MENKCKKLKKPRPDGGDGTLTSSVSRLIVQRPAACFVGCSTFIVMMVVICVYVGALGMSETGKHNWVIADLDASRNADAFESATAQVDQLSATDGFVRTLPSDGGAIQVRVHAFPVF